MSEALFSGFVLVGGTSLSLQLGHRKSVDIDLFSAAEYGTIKWESLLAYFKNNFEYTSYNNAFPPAFGISLFAGHAEDKCVKIDLYYTEPFIFPIQVIDNIRFASIEEILAMKLDIISRGGRKKDFWDIHALIDRFQPEEMIGFFRKRYPFYDDLPNLQEMLHSFDRADEDWDPVCLLGKHWELIKLGIYEYFTK